LSYIQTKKPPAKTGGFFVFVVYGGQRLSPAAKPRIMAAIDFVVLISFSLHNSMSTVIAATSRRGRVGVRLRLTPTYPWIASALRASQ